MFGHEKYMTNVETDPFDPASGRSARNSPWNFTDMKLATDSGRRSPGRRPLGPYELRRQSRDLLRELHLDDVASAGTDSSEFL